MEFEYFKKQNGKIDRSTKPKWDKFDCIWCISRTDDKKFRKYASEFFRSSGISDSGRFNWNYVSDSVFDQILFDFTTKNLGRNACQNLWCMTMAKAHFDCIKKSFELGHDTILVIEDMAKFEDNVQEIAKIVNNIPEDADFVNLGAFLCGIGEEERKSLFCGERTNGMFVEYKKLGSSLCYVMNHKAMEFSIRVFQSVIKQFDRYFVEDFAKAGLKCYMPIKPICTLNNI